MKKKAPQVLTAIVLTVVLGIFAYRQRGPVSREGDTPEATIWRMVDASRNADLNRYMKCYTGELEQRLRQNLRDMGPGKFRDYLTSSQRQLKGIAVSPPQASSPTETRVSVEYVYEDRNEVQQVYLRQVGKNWKIFRVEGAERVKTLVPYGTRVTD